MSLCTWWRLKICTVELLKTYTLGAAILSFVERLSSLRLKYCTSIIEKGPQIVSFIERFFSIVSFIQSVLY